MARLTRTLPEKGGPDHGRLSACELAVRDAPRDVTYGGAQIASQAAARAGGSGDVGAHGPRWESWKARCAGKVGAIPSSATRVGRPIAGPRPPCGSRLGVNLFGRFDHGCPSAAQLAYPRPAAFSVLVPFDADPGMDRLGQAVQHIRPQRSRAFEEFAQDLRGNTGLGREVADQTTAAMEGPAQMAAERIFALGFHHPVVPLAKLRQLLGNQRPFSPQLPQQFRRWFL